MELLAGLGISRSISTRIWRTSSPQHGAWVYALLFAIVFFETGLVVTPFLPGDSLLFVAGALAAAGGMDIAAVMAVLVAAALTGDNVNYWIGRWVGPRMFHYENRAGSTRRTWRARTPSTRATAARPSSSRASCRSCAPTCRSSPASAPCPTRATSASAWPARSLGGLAVLRGLLLRQHPGGEAEPERRDPADRAGLGFAGADRLAQGSPNSSAPGVAAGAAGSWRCSA